MVTDIDYWAEGIVMAIFENIKPEWGKTGAHATQIVDQIDLMVKIKPTDEWSKLFKDQKLDLVSKAFKALAKKRTVYVGEKEEKTILPKKLVRVGKFKDEPLYALIESKNKNKNKGKIVRPSYASEGPLD